MAENMKRREFVQMVSSSSSKSCNKKRKLGNDDVESPESSTVKKSLRVTDLKSVVVDDDDLKVKDCETNFSTSVDRFSREKTPTSELSGEEFDSSSTSTKRKSMTTMPSEAELEEFFAAEEKYQHEQFAEKYNFDVVKDVPLKGKYQWVRLHP